MDSRYNNRTRYFFFLSFACILDNKNHLIFTSCIVAYRTV